MPDDANALDAAALLGTPRLRFVATGNTYAHRETLTSWGWYWNAKRRTWINENETSADELCIAIIRDLPGVTVRCVGPVEE